MRALNRNLKKVPFYRLTSTDSGVILSRTETQSGQEIVRSNTPPRPLSERDTQPWLEALPSTMPRYHRYAQTIKNTVMTYIRNG